MPKLRGSASLLLSARKFGSEEEALRLLGLVLCVVPDPRVVRAVIVRSAEVVARKRLFSVVGTVHCAGALRTFVVFLRSLMNNDFVSVV